jgi:nicotinate-nucleotide--dimethylbenzimidazole phosphoribosyltransferase
VTDVTGEGDEVAMSAGAGAGVGAGAGEPGPSGGAAAAGAYPEEQREAVYRVIRERRDVRQGFLPDPVDDATLERVLAAAHQAPSVGFS